MIPCKPLCDRALLHLSSRYGVSNSPGPLRNSDNEVTDVTTPEGPTIKKIQSRSKFSISIEFFNLARKFQSRRLDFSAKNRAAVGGLLENYILARNFQPRSKSRIFLIFGPSGTVMRTIIRNENRWSNFLPTYFCSTLSSLKRQFQTGYPCGHSWVIHLMSKVKKENKPPPHQIYKMWCFSFSCVPCLLKIDRERRQSSWESKREQITKNSLRTQKFRINKLFSA